MTRFAATAKEMAAAIASYGDVSDAVGYCYQQGQHQFYQISFPGADKTWCYDISTGQWDERPWIDANGVEHRHRAQCQAAAYGANVVLDWQTGDLYALDPDTYTDAGAPIVRRRGFPHMIGDGNRVGYRQFIADMEVGRATAAAGDPKIYLRWSDDHGVTWGNPIAATLGRTGDTLQSIQYQRLGFARDRVFELFWSAPVRTALNGAFIEAKMFGS